MGSWNGTCAVSNLHILAGQDVAVFMLAEKKKRDSFCYVNAMYDLCPIPFYGKYNDYGGVEDCHGFGMNIVVDAIRNNLFEFELGENEYHDIEVKQGNFDVNKLFEADHEDRLGIVDVDYWSQSNTRTVMKTLEAKKNEVGELAQHEQTKLDRLYLKFVQSPESFRRVTHVAIHGDIFRSIMNDFYDEVYVGDGKGTCGYDNDYIRVYFKDIADSIPEYIRRLKETRDKATPFDTGINMNKFHTLFFNSILDDTFSWNDSNLAGQWMTSNTSSGSSASFSIINIKEEIVKYIEKFDWDSLACFTKEVLTGIWVNFFMRDTRKIWTKQSGQGSQSQSHIGYNALINSMKSILDAENAEYNSED